jgi:hypothetical protein
MTKESRAGLRGEGWDEERRALFWDEVSGLCKEIDRKKERYMSILSSYAKKNEGSL